MRGKRSKQYRKLMQQYGLNFGFREPYQVLVDAEIIKDADKFKMDLYGGLERTLHGEVKIMITQCSMRHLYACASEPGVSYLIDKAKTYERRRCGHLPADHPEPLSAHDCISSVVDPKSSGANKHRYVVASQEDAVRRAMRAVAGVPLVYIKRSVMIMEPMADKTAGVRESAERGKFKDGLRRGVAGKRKRDDGDVEKEGGNSQQAGGEVQKKKARFGAKEPNPLSVKKKKPKKGTSTSVEAKEENPEKTETMGRKRKRKPKLTAEGSAEGGAMAVEDAYELAILTSPGGTNMPEDINLPPQQNNEGDKGTPPHFSPIKGETGEVWVLDEWGLLVRKKEEELKRHTSDGASDSKVTRDLQEVNVKAEEIEAVPGSAQDLKPETARNGAVSPAELEEEFKDTRSTPVGEMPIEQIQKKTTPPPAPPEQEPDVSKAVEIVPEPHNVPAQETPKPDEKVADVLPEAESAVSKEEDDLGKHLKKNSARLGISEWSHQIIAPRPEIEKEPEEDEWQDMPAYAAYDIYDDDNRLIAREERESEMEKDAYEGLGGAGKGYTRVMLDEDAQSATSMDDNTNYLFNDTAGTGAGEMEDDQTRDAVAQMQATKDLLTEGQRIAYVGMTRLALSTMCKKTEETATTRGSKKEIQSSAEAMKMWSQKMMMQQAAEKENWNEDEYKENRRKKALNKRYMMMGLATVGGTLVIGLSAGLLAPLIGAGLAAGFTTIGVAGTGGFLAGAGGAAIITTAAATSGGVIAVRAANRRTGAVKTFEYRPLHNNKRVNLIITVSGWMTGKVDDVRLPYSTVDPIMGDIYSVLWEPEMLQSMGDTINILATEALTQGLQQLLASTILTVLMSALQLPVVLTKLAYLIDNPWTVSLDRANAAGLILADSIMERNLGTRPITFVGYSLGSRVIFSCLAELARKGAYGLVQNVYLFGSPIVAKKDEYLKVRSVVAGRFVNGYATNDWILGYLFRLTSGGISRVAGLAPVNGIPGLENVNVTELVPGHMAYRTAMPRLLREVGWIVNSDEFTEIEDPDPENHQQRQRELINEIEEARKEFEKEEKGKKKGKFSFFGRKKDKATKREWETYEESKDDPSSARKDSGNEGVLFDIDAIRAELASEQMEVRELKSTLPPMKLDLRSPTSPRDSLRVSQSYDQTTMLQATNGGYRHRSPSLSPRPSSTTPPTSWPVEISPTLQWPTQDNVRRPSFGALGSSQNMKKNLYDYDEHDDGEIQMSFDTAYKSCPRFVRSSFIAASTPHSATQLPRLPTPDPPRPELKTSQTLPALGSMSIDQNAWADDDEDFGHEKEIEMTFA
ncbi:hypothetical protein BJ878DRAFT_536507 [Calycina marina]|uniref:U three protein 23 n=1 Tax=Calycina marina TaxID=1763456 RepID=A0A9P8CC03_9HELO|nr:hypothetical protein BJ878DRAFT_536507 [Calycina marina]